MKYVGLLVGYVDPDRRWETASPQEQEREMATHGAFGAAVAEREGCAVVGGEALTAGDSATVLRVVGGEPALTDGPFSEATEAIGGFYVLQAPDLDTAVDLFRHLSDYVIEIRPTDPAFDEE